MREESAFQGGDGYLLFGTPELALATITRIAEQTYHPAAGPIEDPVYADPDFAADFFATVRAGMEGLVEDAGYGALLGAFGPALLDATGSRPSARQSDGMGRRRAHPPPARAARHPEQRDPAAARLVREHAARDRRGGGAAPGDVRRDARTTAAGSTARWIWRRTRWRIPTSTCCAR